MGMEKKRGVKAEERGIKSGRREGKREENIYVSYALYLYIYVNLLNSIFLNTSNHK